MINYKQRFLSMGGQIFPKSESKHLASVHQDPFYSPVYLFAEVPHRGPNSWGILSLSKCYHPNFFFLFKDENFEQTHWFLTFAIE